MCYIFGKKTCRYTKYGMTRLHIGQNTKVKLGYKSLLRKAYYKVNYRVYCTKAKKGNQGSGFPVRVFVCQHWE